MPFSALVVLLTTSSCWAAQPPKTEQKTEQKTEYNFDRGEVLTMKSAIAKAMLANPTLRQAHIALELADIAYKNAWAAMYMPTIAFNMNAASPYTLAQIPNSPVLGGPEGGMPGVGASNTNPTLDHGAVSGLASIAIGQYTIFNFGKDRDTYDAARLEIERQREIIHDVERNTRLTVMNLLYTLKTQQDLVESGQRSVDASQAIEELITSRVPLGKATESDLSSAKVDLLNAKNALIQQVIAYSSALWALNQALGDPIDHSYNVKAILKYEKFRLSLDEVIRLFKEYSPDIKTARKTLEQSELLLRVAEKNAMPLPSITFSGITVGYNAGPQGSTTIRDTAAAPGIVPPSPTPTSGNFDVSASVVFTIPLVGAGGFLNERVLRTAELTVDTNELALRNAANNGEITARTQFMNIIQLESQIDNNDRLFKESLKVFESALAAVQSKAVTNRLDLKDALTQLRTAEQAYSSSVLQHFSAKVALATVVGVEHLTGSGEPGEGY